MTKFLDDRKTIAVMAVAAMLGGPMTAVAEEHAHDGSAPHALTLNHGKKWPTDAPLRTGMTRIRDALAADLDTIHAGRFEAEQYDRLATRVDQELAAIVRNCKLPADADANLHVILAEMIAGAEAMHGKDPNAKPADGAVKVVEALAVYPRYFDHPGWKGLEH